MLLRRLAVALATPALLLLSAPHAVAASGSVADPGGDFPDILRLSYDNAPTRVVMTLKFASVADADARSFYIQWGKPQKYQVFDSPSVPTTELRLFRADGTFAKVRCAGLKVTQNADTNTVRAVVPRSCLSKAPDRVQFKGIATLGNFSSDQTKLSPLVRRG